jgi:hypothetical protein
VWGEIQGLDNLLCRIIVRHDIWKVGFVKEDRGLRRVYSVLRIAPWDA